MEKFSQIEISSKNGKYYLNIPLHNLKLPDHLSVLPAFENKENDKIDVHLINFFDDLKKHTLDMSDRISSYRNVLFPFYSLDKISDKISPTKFTNILYSSVYKIENTEDFLSFSITRSSGDTIKSIKFPVPVTDLYFRFGPYKFLACKEPIYTYEFDVPFPMGTLVFSDYFKVLFKSEFINDRDFPAESMYITVSHHVISQEYLTGLTDIIQKYNVVYKFMDGSIIIKDGQVLPC